MTPKSEIQNPKSPLAVPAGYGYGTHLPALAHYVLRTSGPVLELGCGLFSTPLLEMLCDPGAGKIEGGPTRRLVTAEQDTGWLMRCCSNSGKDRLVFDRPDLALDTEPHWAVVLIDHAKQRRQADLIALADRATYLVVHDANCPAVYGYDFSSFNYRRLWRELSPTTMVLSNEVQP